MRPQLCRAGTAKFPYYPRKRIWEKKRGEGPPRLLPLRASLRAGYIIEKMPPANRQLGRLDEFSPTKLTPQVKIHGRAAPFPESCARQQLSPVIASFQSRRLGLLAHCSFQITICALIRCVLASWGKGQRDDDLTRLMRAPRSPRSNRPSA